MLVNSVHIYVHTYIYTHALVALKLLKLLQYNCSHIPIMVSSTTRQQTLIDNHKTAKWWSKDTVAIVTGANKGIGYALVKQFAKLGLTVVLTARDKTRGLDAMDSVKALGLDDNVHFCQLDISERASIASFVSWFKSRFESFDILVSAL